MSFNSLDYIVFLPIAFALFYFTRDNWRWAVLLVASLCFYGALREPILILSLSSVILQTYFCGKMMASCGPSRRRSAAFYIGVAGNLFILVYLKYFNFLMGGLNTIFAITPAS